MPGGRCRLSPGGCCRLSSSPRLSRGKEGMGSAPRPGSPSLSGLSGLLSGAGRPNLPFLFPLFGFASCWSAYLLYTSSGSKQMSSAFTWEPCSDLPPVVSSWVLCTCVRCAGSWEPPADFICSFPDRLPVSPFLVAGQSVKMKEDNRHLHKMSLFFPQGRL